MMFNTRTKTFLGNGLMEWVFFGTAVMLAILFDYRFLILGIFWVENVFFNTRIFYFCYNHKKKKGD